MPRPRTRRDADAEIGSAAAFRTELRRFLRRTKTVTAEAGLTPERYDLLLMVRAAASGGAEVRLTDLCDALQLRQTAVSELVKRAEAAGLIRKEEAAADGRAVSLRLTEEGERRLEHAFEVLRADREALRGAFGGAEARFRELSDAQRRR